VKCLLIYDIPDDQARDKVANFCKDYGLDRVQYSAFVGELSTNHQEELMLKIEKRLGKSTGRIDLFAICKEDWRKRLSFCQDMVGLGAGNE
jgi:CRISPR-associated protein Cas2